MYDELLEKLRLLCEEYDVQIYGEGGHLVVVTSDKHSGVISFSRICAERIELDK